MAIKEKRNGGWSVRWLDPDGSNRRKQCPDARTADALIREIEEAHALGRRWEPVARRDPSVSALVDEYLVDRRRLWAPNTVIEHDVSLSIFQSWLIARSRRSHVGIAALSKGLLGDFWDHLIEGRKNAVSTARLRVGHVLRWWRWCYDHDDYGSTTPRPPQRYEMRPAPRVPTRAPTWAQMDAVIGACTVERVRRLAVLLRCTGLRYAQALALEWDDLDLEGAELRVRPELGKTAAERTGRTIPLAPVLVSELAGWGLRQGRVVGVVKTENADCKALRKAWEASGTPRAVWYDRTAHCFRKGFVTGLRALGGDRDAIELLVGHDLGLPGIYTDQVALKLREAVALVPPLGPDNVHPMRVATAGT